MQPPPTVPKQGDVMSVEDDMEWINKALKSSRDKPLSSLMANCPVCGFAYMLGALNSEGVCRSCELDQLRMDNAVLHEANQGLADEVERLKRLLDKWKDDK